jgi:hypothetical protein
LDISTDKLAAWMKPGRYVSGHELAAAGLAELVELAPQFQAAPRPPEGKRKRR